MVAKLVLGLLAVVVIVVAATGMAFWYFNKESERAHQKDMKRMEQTDELIEIAEDDDDL